ncbi:TetR/AcrR family transcriptional regulator [Pelotomaculum isophthalicicum JI]|uniref:TetR/AcrR family transcriptional regulator n=1 Tax=Pelotomaculum isophthalicicum JI TaxID=947010 RepID=A0A9X4JV52_9FIRM|nr:TetR/AcrR family transcriptional regulator [Pelotomaculum isophthalicicum]MDF9406898.1 TetR/AcrR family transcriptional regulator [Pelotomaculum isophthalicicum JI]
MDYKRRILTAFNELALQRGFSGVTMDELATRAGVSKRTIYRYFNSKEEIIDTLLNDILSGFEQKILQMLDSCENPVEKISNIIKIVPRITEKLTPAALHDLHKYYPHLWEKIEQFRARRIQHLFDDLLLNNKYRCFKSVNPKIFTTALLASIRSVVNPAFIIDNNLSVEETIQTLFTIFLSGIVLEE